MNTMNYDAMASMGACGPVGCGVPGYGAYGAYPYGYPAVAPAGIAPFFGGDVVRTDIIGRQAPPAQAPAEVGRGLTHWDIVGQATTTTTTTATEQPWLQRPGPLGVKNQWWLVGSAAIGLTWLAYSMGWFGGILGGNRGGRRSGGDFDDVAGDFFF